MLKRREGSSLVAFLGLCADYSPSGSEPQENPAGYVQGFKFIGQTSQGCPVRKTSPATHAGEHGFALSTVIAKRLLRVAPVQVADAANGREVVPRREATASAEQEELREEGHYHGEADQSGGRKKGCRQFHAHHRAGSECPPPEETGPERYGDAGGGAPRASQNAAATVKAR